MNVPTAAKARRPRRWFRWLLALPFLFAAASILQVVVLRFVDPPFTAFMAARMFEAWGQGEWGFRIAYDWRDMERIAPSLPVSMVAAEDQNFAVHRGFDLAAIEKARAHNRKMVERAEKRGRPVTRLRGASTISQQVAKNLFLWQGRHAATRWARKGLEAWYTVRLTPAESARLAAVLPAPRRYSAQKPGPYVQRQARRIQRQVGQIGGTAYLETLR
jgi:monofunctional biosynthetic peptidoglycan transglycosylase